MASADALAPPPFVRLAGDPLRWRLLRELAGSDRRVRELVDAVEQPQNLVSYHLGRLRDAGLVTARRSSFDGRDTYYHLDLDRCAHALADTGTALHPALRLEPPPAASSGGASAGVVPVHRKQRAFAHGRGAAAAPDERRGRGRQRR